MPKRREKRLFIAINLPEALKDKIEEKLEEIRYDFTSDIRFMSRENWHITIIFLGAQSDEAIGDIVAGMSLIGDRFEAPEIGFTDIGYGPIGKAPRMIWLNGNLKTSKALHAIRRQLEDDLIDRGILFKREHRQMRVHVTLARFESAADLPDIKIDLPFRFFAEGIDLMESQLKPSGAEYEILQHARFKSRLGDIEDASQK